MFSEMRQSLTATLQDRLISPFYGAFIASWLLWNWRIPYVTFFVSEGAIKQPKVDWIIENNSSLWLLVWYPLISSAALVLIFPFVTNGAYWVSIRFTKWRSDQKNKVDRSTLLTVQQSIALREQMQGLESRLETIIQNKNDEIKRLTVEIEDLRRSKSESAGAPELDAADKLVDSGMAVASEGATKALALRIHGDPKLHRTFIKAIEYAQAGYSGLLQDKEVSKGGVAFLEAHDLIESRGDGLFGITATGKRVVRSLPDYE